MATSIVSVNGRHEIFNDFDLLLVFRMILSKIDDKDIRFASLKRDLKDELESYAPGTLGAALEKHGYDSSIREFLVAVLEDLEASLSTLGSSVPLSHLKRNWRIKGVMFMGPYPASKLVMSIQQLRDLLKRES